MIFGKGRRDKEKAPAQERKTKSAHLSPKQPLRGLGKKNSRSKRTGSFPKESSTEISLRFPEAATQKSRS
jgi:hypothetical protein